MKKDKKFKLTRKKILIILPILILFLIVIGVSYSFIIGDITYISKTNTKLKANTLGLKYTGVTEVNCSNIIPGDKCIKTFEVENTSNVATYYNIFMKNVTNEFDEDLVYTLEKDDSSFISETVLPVTKEGKTYLKKNITIAAKPTKHRYKLVIEFKYDASKNQNVNQNKTFKATVGIDTIQGDSKVYKNGELVYYDVTQNRGCSYDEYVANEENTLASNPNLFSGCMRWYAFLDDDESSTIRLFLGHAISSRKSITEANTLLDGYNAQYSGLDIRLISLKEIAQITGADKLDIDFDNPAYPDAQFNFVYETPVKGYSTPYPAGTNGLDRGQSPNGWLFDTLSGCYVNGCDFDPRLTYGVSNYLTSTQDYGSSSYWTVEKDGYTTTETGSVRPVITVKKSKLLDRTYDKNCKKVTGDGTHLGDTIRCYTEDFYVLTNDGSKITAIAKYNLNVGDKKNPSYTEGLQAWTQSGYIADYTYNGVPEVAYNASAPQFTYKFNSDSALYSYVSNYQTYLRTNTNLTNLNARLINEEELIAVNCDPDYNSATSYNNSGKNCDLAPTWFRGISFWTGVQAPNGSSCTVKAITSIIDSIAELNSTYYGVRPVIEIDASDLN